jgi:hypothetical protein
METDGAPSRCFKKCFNPGTVSVPLSGHAQGRPAIANQIKITEKPGRDGLSFMQ